MIQQTLSVLLAALLVSVGQLTLTCPQARCGMMRAGACCRHDGFTRPSCCPPMRTIRGASPAGRHGDDDHLLPVAPGALAFIAQLIRSAVASPAPTQREAPHGTLFSQRTSLVL